jgi:hypothetical protein
MTAEAFAAGRPRQTHTDPGHRRRLARQCRSNGSISSFTAISRSRSRKCSSRVRGIGVSLSFAVAVTIFGGFTPFIATWLIAETGNSLSPRFYIMFTAALSIIAIAFVHRRRYPR